MTGDLPVLIFEPQALLRQTVALTSSAIGVGPIYQAATLDAASRHLMQRGFAAAIISLDAVESDTHRAQAIGLIQDLREGRTPSLKSLHVLVTVSSCDRVTLQTLQSLGVHRILLKPFKARLLIDALTALSASSPARALAEN